MCVCVCVCAVALQHPGLHSLLLSSVTQKIKINRNICFFLLSVACLVISKTPQVQSKNYSPVLSHSFPFFPSLPSQPLPLIPSPASVFSSSFFLAFLDLLYHTRLLSSSSSLLPNSLPRLPSPPPPPKTQNNYLEEQTRVTALQMQ